MTADEVDDDDHVSEDLADFGVRFRRPNWWESRVDHDGETNTYVYWDEFIGTLRVTPTRPAGDRLVIDEFLERRFAEAHAKNPEWRTYNGHRFMYYVEDSSREPTRLHYLIGGHRDLLLVCSFAYGLELIDDEDFGDDLEDTLEELEKVFESITFTG